MPQQLFFMGFWAGDGATWLRERLFSRMRPCCWPQVSDRIAKPPMPAEQGRGADACNHLPADTICCSGPSGTKCAASGPAGAPRPRPPTMLAAWRAGAARRCRCPTAGAWGPPTPPAGAVTAAKRWTLGAHKPRGSGPSPPARSATEHWLIFRSGLDGLVGASQTAVPQHAGPGWMAAPACVCLPLRTSSGHVM